MTTEHLRAAVAIAWACACLCLSLPAARAMFGRVRTADPWKAVAFWCGMLFCAFPSRAMIRPADDHARIALFTLSLSLSLALLVIGMTWRDWRGGKG